MDEALLRSLTPGVLAVLVRRGADCAAPDIAVQDALVEAVRAWPADTPRDPKGRLVTLAWRRFLDARRADAARRQREDHLDEEPAPGPAPATGWASFRPRPPSLRCTPTPPPPGRPTGWRSSSGKAPNLAERDHLTRQAARLNSQRHS